ncbi:MAG: glycosyltransferase [Candidatus Woesebacteria bacterium]|nr:MAG: glycosyltransferase [Candidatus Woesebacteria bacterium]
MTNPLISIIIPAKNEEKNIGRLLESIKRQTYKKIQIVLVDDGSTDKTVEISKRFSKYVYKRKHLERSIQRNFGAKKAHGSFLVFLDADMELTPKVIEASIKVQRKTKAKAITIAEKTVGNNLIAKIRTFERQMYLGDKTIELARFFEKKVFWEFKGYDPSLTGPEDYDLPYRIGKKYKISRCSEYILHHEENITLTKLLKKKYYYASKGALYARKHPELIKTQGNLFFRKAYFKNWKNFIKNPFLGTSFIFIRILESIWATAGYISAVGITGFFKTSVIMFKP